MSDNPNLAVLERFTSAVAAGDGETVRALCAPGFELHEGSGLSFAGTYAGGEGFLEFLGIFVGALEIERLETTRIYQSDDPDCPSSRHLAQIGAWISGGRASSGV